MSEEGAAARSMHTLLLARFPPWQSTRARWTPWPQRLLTVDFLLRLSGMQQPEVAEKHIYKLKLFWF